MVGPISSALKKKGRGERPRIQNSELRFQNCC